MNVVCFGAHPDDCELFAGGTCVKWARAGHSVLMVSLTNGDIGHHEMAGGPLARRRAAEAERSSALAGCEHLILDHHDGELQPTLELRREIVRIIRSRKADLVVTHRACDYHPDHRYAAMAVQDAAYMVLVPHFCPDTPRLEANPVFCFMMDRFQRPYPHQAHIAVDVDDVMETKWDMLDAMDSQFYEWLPWISGMEPPPPAQDAAARRAWLPEAFGPWLAPAAALGRDALARWYGADHAEQVEFAEFFEICEYGKQPAGAEIRALFPFLPKGALV